MAQQTSAHVENNFTKGLITESTGLNFPENAATDTDNCTFTLIGDIYRRQGIDYEANFVFNDASVALDRTNKAMSTYKWNNAGGDGHTQIVVKQVGNILEFYSSTDATVASPLSVHRFGSTIDISTFLVGGNSSITECQYADGNGFLFVYHPNLDPFYCTYDNGNIFATRIFIYTRDFAGVTENPPIAKDQRTAAITPTHLYNLLNQGWGHHWAATSTGTFLVGAPSTYAVPINAAGLPIKVGDSVNMSPTVGGPLMSGSVISYVGTTLTLQITVATGTGTFSSWNVNPSDYNISGWLNAVGSIPSNSDVWWKYRNASNVFDPKTTLNTVTSGGYPAPKGHFILNEFNQLRTPFTGSTTVEVPNIITPIRPKTGCWFAGRVWYTGVDSSVVVGTETHTWTESIYFSQIIQNNTEFGNCYQANDPTNSDIFDLLPSDGGVIKVQGCGSIYKLFPLQNALLVFAANGVWYITGSQGIGFTANDYTVVKLSAVQSISSTSFVNVNGLPYFWNEEGIYAVEPAKQGTSLLSSPLHVNPLEVNPVTIGTILTFYQNIPASSKKHARGEYHPIDYTIQWLYRDTEETSITDRYNYNKLLNYITVNKAFFPYTVSTGTNVPAVNGIVYVNYPGGQDSPLPAFKYLTSAGPLITSNMTFAEERDASFVDWKSNDGVGVNYISYFVTGYKLSGQAIKKFQPQYIQVYSNNDVATKYKIQGVWNYANDPNSGKYSTAQLITNAFVKFKTIFRRHKIRGSGYVLQFKVSSVDGQLFHIQGWAVVDTVNAGT